MFKLMGKKIITILRSKYFYIWTYVNWFPDTYLLKWILHVDPNQKPADLYKNYFQKEI